METRAAKRKRVLDTCADGADGISPKRQRRTVVVTPGCLSRELRGLGFEISSSAPPQPAADARQQPRDLDQHDDHHHQQQQQHNHHDYDDNEDVQDERHHSVHALEQASSPSSQPLERCSHLRLGIKYDAIRKNLLDSSQWYCQGTCERLRCRCAAGLVALRLLSQLAAWW